jgi:hypothetical protein
MKKLKGYVEEAYSKAGTEGIYARRVAIFDKGVWQYMLRGRELYVKKMKSEYGSPISAVRIPMAINVIDKSLAGTEVSEALRLDRWRCLYGDPTSRKDVLARFIHNGKELYIILEESMLRSEPVIADDITGGDYWQILLASGNGENDVLYELLVSGKKANGKMIAEGVDSGWDFGGSVEGRIIGSNCWQVVVKVPLEKMGLKEVEIKGGKIFMNVIRRNNFSKDEPMLSPSFVSFTDRKSLIRFLLDDKRSIVFAMQAMEEGVGRADTNGLIGRWLLNEGTGKYVRAENNPLLMGEIKNYYSMLPGERVWGVDENGQSVLDFKIRNLFFINFGTQEVFNVKEALSLAVWVKPVPDSVLTHHTLVYKGRGKDISYSIGLYGSRNASYPGFDIMLPLLAMDGGESNAERIVFRECDYPVVAGEWNFVVATYDGHQMNKYINGRKICDGKKVNGAIKESNGALRFGWNGADWYFYTGLVSDFAIYHRALKPVEIMKEYLYGRKRLMDSMENKQKNK